MIDSSVTSAAEKERPMNRPPEEKISHLVKEEQRLSFLETFLTDFPDGEVFLVGGAVRDAILGRANKDFDFIVRNIPRKKMEEWFQKNGRVDLVGSRFGIYKFSPNGADGRGIPIDIALPRTERSTTDSMGGARDFKTQSDETLPVETDLSRRDFTFNAMAFDVKNSRLVDPFGGMNDLKKRVVRAVGEPIARFSEDLSRMLRAIRFASQLGCEIEQETWNAIQKKMPEISLQRIRDGKSEYVVPRDVIGKEIAKALKADPAKTTILLKKSGAIRELLPSLHAAMEASGEEYIKPLQKKPLSLTASVALLFRGIPFTEIAPALAVCGLSLQSRKESVRIEAQDIEWIVFRLQENNAADPQSVRAYEFERTYFSKRGSELLEALSALEKNKFLENVRNRMKQMCERLGISDGEQLPPPLVSGKDVVARGISPGPDVRYILLDLRDAQLEGWVRSRTEALEYLKKISQKTRNFTS